MYKIAVKPIYKSPLFFYAIVALWFTVNIFQALYSGLINDEAYYWFYSRDLAWGYYDHPPLIALLIKAGYFVFPNFLGVRIFIVLLSTVLLILLKKIIKPTDFKQLSVFIFSIFILQAEGFIAVPDTVFIFFVTLFFYSYCNYLINDSVKNVILLSFSIIGMFYSKYFAILVVILTIISNIKIIKRKSFWVIFSFSTAAMIPHLMWQINHDFITFYFHLKERNINMGFNLNTMFEFIGGQLLLLNPLTAYFILKYFIKSGKKNVFQKTLWLNVVGMFGFAFLISLFKRVEANWTVSALVPLIILSYPEFEKEQKSKNSFYLLGTISLILVVLLRLNLIFNFFGEKAPGILKQFYGWNKASQKIKTLAGDDAVVFSCSYQNASQYYFYTGKQAFTFNNLFYRKNQYDLSGMEPKLSGKPALYIKDTKYLDKHFKKPFIIPEPDSILIFDKWWYYKKVNNYYSYNFLKIKIKLSDNNFKTASEINIPIELINTLDSSIIISPGVDSYLSVCFAKGNRPFNYIQVKNITGLKLNNSYKTNLKVITPNKPGKYFLWVSVQTGWLSPAINHRVYKVKIEN